MNSDGSTEATRTGQPTSADGDDSARSGTVSAVNLAVSGNSVEVSWQAPADDAAIVEYRAFVLDAEGNPAYQCTSTVAGCMVADVLPGSYTAVVRVAYGSDLGPPSEESASVEVT